jgi:hypothetical protein
MKNAPPVQPCFLVLEFKPLIMLPCEFIDVQFNEVSMDTLLLLRFINLLRISWFESDGGFHLGNNSNDYI